MESIVWPGQCGRESLLLALHEPRDQPPHLGLQAVTARLGLQQEGDEASMSIEGLLFHQGKDPAVQLSLMFMPRPPFRTLGPSMSFAVAVHMSGLFGSAAMLKVGASLLPAPLAPPACRCCCCCCVAVPPFPRAPPVPLLLGGPWVATAARQFGQGHFLFGFATAAAAFARLAAAAAAATSASMWARSTPPLAGRAAIRVPTALVSVVSARKAGVTRTAGPRLAQRAFLRRSNVGPIRKGPDYRVRERSMGTGTHVPPRNTIPAPSASKHAALART